MLKHIHSLLCPKMVDVTVSQCQFREDYMGETYERNPFLSCDIDAYTQSSDQNRQRFDVKRVISFNFS